MSQGSNKTLLQQANEVFRNGLYNESLDLYLSAINNNPSLRGIIKINVGLALQRLGQKIDMKSIDDYIDNKVADSKLKSENVATIHSKLDSSDEKTLERILTYRNAFDDAFYNKRYPDIKQAGADAFAHYSSWGWREGRLPNAWFDPTFYLECYQDARATDKDPLLHYVEVGQFEKRKTKVFSISAVSDSVKENIPKIKFDNVSEGYVDFVKHDDANSSVKLLAFYLPQFHPFPENDAWWGKGFTEWTNVSKAKPNFKGHYQPHLPIHNGFYDLRVPEVMAEQARLAKNYGIHGFNFYYYWFDGKVLMHKPFEILLNHKEIDINYCITWANENWTRRWDGAENDVLIGQNHCEEDSIKFIEHLYIYFRDERYIKVDNKPVLIIYRANIIPDMAETINLWRRKVKEAGFDGIYLIAAETFGFKNPQECGFDAAIEFPPHTVKSNKINSSLEIINENYEGSIYSYDEVVRNACMEREPEYKRFRTAMLSWDNTARKQHNGNIFANFSMLKYKQWLSHIATHVYNNSKYSKEEKFIFINAWNEWAEGTHLEPDRERGYAYLQTTHDILKELNEDNFDALASRPLVRKNNYAVVLHIHYTEVWQDILAYLDNLNEFGFDLYVTITNTDNHIVDSILKKYPEAQITFVENRGRDIRPFIDVYKKIKDLGHTAICKIHSKKSTYRDDGDKIRDEIFESLLGSKEQIKNIITQFKNTEAGLITLGKYLIPHTDKNMTYDREIVYALADLLEFDFEYSIFPAGSMFWFTPNALKGLEKIEDYLFEPEEGLADGTLAHGIERILCALTEKNDLESKSL